jgi:cytochrome c5
VRICAVIFLMLLAGSVAAQTTSPNTKTSTYDEKVGKKIYKYNCALCHDTGSGGAPKIRDKQKWTERLKKDNNILTQEVIHGYKLMPPKGNCYKCTDQEIADAVEYLRGLVTK